MTESEWLTSQDPAALLLAVMGSAGAFALPRPSARKLRLFACACARRNARAWITQLPLSGAATAIEDAEKIADGDRPQAYALGSAVYWVLQKSATEAATSFARLSGAPDDSADRADLLRDVVGNPFHPVTVAPSWLTADVLRIAHGAYGERTFAHLPILADALEDAGCSDNTILSHLRSPGPHVRGCWVIDLILSHYS